MDLLSIQTGYTDAGEGPDSLEEMSIGEIIAQTPVRVMIPKQRGVHVSYYLQSDSSPMSSWKEVCRMFDYPVLTSSCLLRIQTFWSEMDGDMADLVEDIPSSVPDAALGAETKR